MAKKVKVGSKNTTSAKFVRPKSSTNQTRPESTGNSGRAKAKAFVGSMQAATRESKEVRKSVVKSGGKNYNKVLKRGGR